MKKIDTRLEDPVLIVWDKRLKEQIFGLPITSSHKKVLANQIIRGIRDVVNMIDADGKRYEVSELWDATGGWENYVITGEKWHYATDKLWILPCGKTYDLESQKGPMEICKCRICKSVNKYSHEYLIEKKRHEERNASCNRK